MRQIKKTKTSKKWNFTLNIGFPNCILIQKTKTNGWINGKIFAGKV
jgi:hypothetical protein